eukprot:jgi/Ulvmu1/9287/UM050_0036.1
MIAPCAEAPPRASTSVAHKIMMIGSGGIRGPAMLRTLVRLAFHDCASAQCDGCIDTSDTLNNPGLAEMIQALQPLCTKYGLNKADCWAAAGSIAAEEASYNGPDLARVPLFFGRTDATTCTGFTQSNPEASFPAAAAGFGPTMDYFSQTFNFSQRETVAILGVHSLGVASVNGSGFDGAWTIAPNTLDNTFFSDMLKGQLGWGIQKLPAAVPLYQWTSATGQQLMLNSDMCLLLDIFNETSGGTSPQVGFGVGGVEAGTAAPPVCTYDTCADSPTAAIVQQYAANNTLFMADFTAVWIKMVTNGYDVCELAVVPAEGSGPDFEELYGIDAITEDCAAESGSSGFNVSGPVTSGVLGGVAPPAEGPDNAPRSVVTVSGDPADAPEEEPAPPVVQGSEGPAGLGLGDGAASVQGAVAPSEAGAGASGAVGGGSGARRLVAAGAGLGVAWVLLGALAL